MVDEVGIDWSKAITDERTRLPARVRAKEPAFGPDDDTNPGLKGSRPSRSETRELRPSAALPDASEVPPAVAWLEKMADGSLPRPDGLRVFRELGDGDRNSVLRYLGTSREDRGAVAVFVNPSTQEGLVSSVPSGSGVLTGLERGDRVLLQDAQKLELLYLGRTGTDGPERHSRSDTLQGPAPVPAAPSPARSRTRGGIER